MRACDAWLPPFCLLGILRCVSLGQCSRCSTVIWKIEVRNLKACIKPGEEIDIKCRRIASLSMTSLLTKTRAIHFAASSQVIRHQNIAATAPRAQPRLLPQYSNSPAHLYSPARHKSLAAGTCTPAARSTRQHRRHRYSTSSPQSHPARRPSPPSPQSRA